MSQDDIDSLREGYAGVNRGDLEGFAQVFDPEIELRLPEGGITTGTVRGLSNARQFLEDYVAAFDTFVMEPERFIEADDGRIVVLVRLSGVGRSSGIEVEVEPTHVWTMQAGEAVTLEILPDRAEALETLGLSD